jgi:hypothetical protein
VATCGTSYFVDPSNNNTGFISTIEPPVQPATGTARPASVGVFLWMFGGGAACPLRCAPCACPCVCVCVPRALTVLGLPPSPTLVPMCACPVVFRPPTVALVATPRWR